MAKPVADCGLTAAEEACCSEIEKRLRALFGQADEIAAQQHAAGTGVHMGNTVRRIREGPNLEGKNQEGCFAALSAMLEQVLYAAVKNDCPLPELLSVIFGRLLIRIDEERMHQKLEIDLIKEVLQNMERRRAAEQQQGGAP